MNEVFAKTRELAEALLGSPEYKAVKQAEARCMDNKEAAELLKHFMDLRNQMELLMSSNEKEWAQVSRLSNEIDECKQAMELNDYITALDKARGEFSDLIGQVNRVLHFIVSGDMESDESAGCGGCAGCGSCSAKVN